VDEVNDAIIKLKSGKSPGVDTLYSEHFKLADKSLSVLLCLLLNSMIQHCFIPSCLMKTVIVPIIKDKKGILTCKDNYRPIAVTTVCSKLVETIILCRIENVLSTSDHQFGFKSKHSTDQCVYALKGIVQYYMQNNSPVYVCFLDASKAFDRINHWTLF
jgi:hypothetical protein